MNNLENILLKALEKAIEFRFDGTPLKLPKERAIKEKRLDEKIKFLKEWLEELK